MHLISRIALKRRLWGIEYTELIQRVLWTRTCTVLYYRTKGHAYPSLNHAMSYNTLDNNTPDDKCIP